jgi:uncharacterized protein (DUF2252 family)
MGDDPTETDPTGTGRAERGPQPSKAERRAADARVTASAADERARGRALRATIPRSGHGTWTPSAARDPLGILEEQNRNRLQSLVGVRMGRMLQTPFAFYRGAAAPMAADLSGDPGTDLRVVACGDAHASNFGLFASPERALLFDVNDFDEASVAPWEWDLKRLAASAHIGGRGNGFSEDDCRDLSRAAATAYQDAMAKLDQMSALDRFYLQVDASRIESAVSGAVDDGGAEAADAPDRHDLHQARKVVAKARKRTSEQTLGKLTTTADDGSVHIVDQPPITRHVDHLGPGDLADLFGRYRGTVRQDTAMLLGQFRVVDIVLRVVGVGSVGTRCYVILLLGPADEPLFLQVKEAQTSVLVTYGGMPAVDRFLPPVAEPGQGFRVVAGQRILQAQSDAFLGWVVGFAGERADRPRVDYYWRQFRDMKGSVDLTRLDVAGFRTYVALCATLLARAHSQSPAVHAIAGYLGPSGPFADAISDWASAYADQNEADHAALDAAARNGRFPVERDV